MIDSYITYFQREPIASLPVFLNLVPLFLIFQRKAFVENTFLILTIYLVFKLCIDFTMFDFASNKKSTILLYNINIPIRYALMAWLYFLKIESITTRRTILLTIPLFIIFSIWEIDKENPFISNVNTHKLVFFSSTIESLLVILWILLYFQEAIRNLKIPNLLTYPFFWVCFGLLLYYSSLLFIAPVMHYDAKWDDYINIGLLFYLPYIFESICLILISVGVYHYRLEIDAKH